jgi:hypothetical protein
LIEEDDTEMTTLDCCGNVDCIIKPVNRIAAFDSRDFLVAQFICVKISDFAHHQQQDY